MRIYHVTNLKSALSIIESKYFTPYSTNIYNSDACLNCFCSLNEANKSPQPLKMGVVIVFHWSGKIKKIGMNDSTPYQNNILYSQEYWRCFIPSNTIGKNLKIVRLDINKRELSDYINITLNLWVKFLPKKCQKEYIKKRRLNFIINIKNSIKQQDCYINIK